jgi:nitrite reductase (NO-forming)
MVFVGIGGEIDGVINPDLLVRPGDRIQVKLINDDGMPHDFAIPDLNAQTTTVTAKGQSTGVVFESKDTGEFAYYCTLPSPGRNGRHRPGRDGSSKQ